MRSLCAVLLAAWLLAGCGEDDPTRANDFVPLSAITIESDNAVMAAGTTTRFRAIGNFSDRFERDITDEVTWSSEPPTVLTMTASGLGTTEAPGDAIVTATQGDVSQSFAVTVADAVLQSLVVSPDPLVLRQGQTRQFTATGTFAAASNPPFAQNITRDVTWASAPGTIATIDTGGLATAVSPGSATITATFGTVSGSAAVTVASPVVESLTLTPVSPTVARGEELQFEAVAQHAGGGSSNVTTEATWESSNDGVATIGASGLATAVAPGSTTIRAGFGGVETATLLTVAAVQAIEITPANPSVRIGETIQLTATGTLTGGGTRNISDWATWSIVSNGGGDAAGGATVARGRVTAGTEPGTVTVRASHDGIDRTAIVSITP